jgi:hypothetical protein
MKFSVNIHEKIEFLNYFDLKFQKSMVAMVKNVLIN